MTFSSLEALLLTLFGLAWLLIIYHHLIYPLILKFVYTQSISPSQADALQEDEISSLPHICILVPAYNEGDVIADKIRNVASLDYPKNKLSLLIACDGCSDDTADIVRKTVLEPEVHELKVELIEYLENRGKVAVLNQTIPQLECDIVGLSDASALISFDSLIICARQFYDDKLGILAATYKLLKPGSNGEKSYWQYQTKVKEIESSLGSPIGVHGALYFFRQHLFTPLPLDTINDDFIIPMEIVAAGYKAQYDTNIIALELEQATNEMDQKRRIRIAAGNFQQAIRLIKLLHPKHKGTAFTFFSGKAMRAMMPLILALQWLVSLALTSISPLFLAFAAVQLMSVMLARYSNQISSDRIPKVLAVIFYLINAYFSSLIGVISYLLGKQKGAWKTVSTKENHHE